MPRSTKEIIDQADALAQRFEEHPPDASSLRSADTLRQVREAFLGRARAESDLVKAVEAARSDGQSWSAIGAMLGTSGEAARQRYGNALAKR
jgi:Flp pilus assembly protein TadD